MNSRQRAYMRKISATIEPIFQVGKSSVTPEITAAIDEALEKREIIKINVLKNCFYEPKEIAQVLADKMCIRDRYNVQQRIKMYFGNAYGLSIYSKEGLFTKVLIQIPADKENGQ